MRKQVVNIVVLLMMIAIMVVSLAFSSGEFSRVKCTGVTVLIKEGSPRFLDEEEIANIIKKSDGKLQDKELYSINTNDLEAKLAEVPSIKNVEVYRHITGSGFDFKGNIIAEVEQRNPIVRIISGNSDYYLDREGVKIPQTDKFSVKVVIANGNISEKFAKERLLPMVLYINDNELWKAMIEQIYVEDDGELVLVPQVGDQLIEFGEPDGFRKKFRNLQALYQQEFSKNGWGRYEKISLKYQNQVVCTKK